MNAQYGLVAFFDILGYQNFLQSNSPAKAIEVIDGLLLRLKALKEERFPFFFGDGTSDGLRKVIADITHLVISDSLILAFKTDKKNMNDYIWSFFTFYMYCTALYKEFFLSGLPVRGAIEYGEFIVRPEDQVFAGTPIVEAYRKTSRIALSACIVGETALLDDFPNTIYSGIVRYTVPFRDGTESKRYLLAPIFGTKDDPVDLSAIGDLRQFIIASFSKHNKDIGYKVLHKIDNTELFFRFCKARYEQDPKPKSRSQ